MDGFQEMTSWHSSLMWQESKYHTLPTDQLFNLEFQFESVFNLEFQPKFCIQLGIPISMGINLGECTSKYNYLMGVNIGSRSSSQLWLYWSRSIYVLLVTAGKRNQNTWQFLLEHGWFSGHEMTFLTSGRGDRCHRNANTCFKTQECCGKNFFPLRKITFEGGL